MSLQKGRKRGFVMKKVISVLLILCMLLTGVLTGCKDSSAGSGANVDNDNVNVSQKDEEINIGDALRVGVDKLPYSDERIFEQLFDINNFIQIEIEISDEELLNIQKDYETYREKGSKSPIYREASMFITIKTNVDCYTYYIENIGLRMKGNTSRTDFYSKEDGQYNLIHYRVKFMDDEFATLDNLELKWNRNDDGTYLREYYAYEMFRDHNILAPHVNLSTLDVGNLYQGVFTIYEPIDKNFIEKYVPEKDQGGDLYKCAWTWNGADMSTQCSIGVEDEENALFYNYDLKTNKKDSTHEQMKNLLKVVNSSSLTKSKLESVVDMDQFLMFSAVSYFVGNPDDMRNNYNNHYIYFMKSSGKAVFIPYDMDRVLGVTKGWNPAADGMTGVSPYSTKAKGANDFQKNPLFIYTVDREKGMYLDEYTVFLKKVAKSDWLTMEKFQSYYEIASVNYSNYTTPGRVFGNSEGFDFSFDLYRTSGLGTEHGNASFEEYLNAKMKAYESFVE